MGLFDRWTNAALDFPYYRNISKTSQAWHRIMMVTTAAEIVLLAAILVLTMTPVQCNSSISKNEIQYLACHIDCSGLGHWLPHMKSMLKGFKKCEEVYKM